MFLDSLLLAGPVVVFELPLEGAHSDLFSGVFAGSGNELGLFLFI